MNDSRVESGLELRLPELGRYQAPRFETGRDQRGNHLGPRFLKVPLDPREGL